MEKKEYLTETNYEKGKKTLKLISLIVLIGGLLIGGSLITAGIVKSNNVKKNVNEAMDDLSNTSNNSRAEKDIQKDIDDTKREMDNLESEISSLETKKFQIFMEDNGLSDRYATIESEIKTKENELSDLKDKYNKYTSELYETQSGLGGLTQNGGKIFDTVTNKVFRGGFSAIDATALYIFGGFIIVVSCIISLAIYLFARRREVLAFTTQQVMPITQEKIDKMAPTVGNAASELAKGIRKGWEEGKKEDK